MSWAEEKPLWIFAIVFIASFFYIWGVVQPPLIFQHQQPVFFWGSDFFAETMQHPGGLVNYLSSLLCQLYNQSVVGAFISALILIGIAIAAHRVFRLLHIPFALYAAMLVFAFVLAAQSNYFYTMSYSLSLLLSLFTFLFYASLARKNFILRIILFSFLSRTLYIFAAAPFLLFVVLGIVYELFILNEKTAKKIIATIIFSFSLLWPILVHQYIFLFNKHEMYTYLLPIGNDFSFYRIFRMAWIMLFIFPLAGVFLSLFKKRQSAKLHIAKTAEIIFLSVFIIALSIFIYSSFDKKHKIVLQIDRHAEHGRFSEVVSAAQENKHVLHRLITLQYNRALCHTGQMLDELFSYPQIEGEHGLIRNFGAAFEFPYAVAVLMFELGNINSAQTWANEALSIEGESPRVLKLLALIHIYKNEPAAAEIYITKIGRTIGNKNWLQQYAGLLEQPHRIKDDPAFATLQAKTVDENFLIRYGNMYGELKTFFKAGRPSIMSFEYLLAYDLLARRLDRVAALAPNVLKLPYKELPRHVEEALILIGISGVDYGVDLSAFDFQPSKVEDVRNFMTIMSKHNNNPRYAQGELCQKYGDTYWYYHIYHQGQEL